MLRVVEAAAIAAAHTMGQGDRKLADQVATETMRKVMESVPMQGTIVIGEGERDEAPMLYIGEQVGRKDANSAAYPQVDIAVDPLEGTNLCGPHWIRRLWVLVVRTFPFGHRAWKTISFGRNLGEAGQRSECRSSMSSGRRPSGAGTRLFDQRPQAEVTA
jgi:hypothetical protein